MEISANLWPMLRRLAMDRWENLTSLLNSDGSGDTKTTEKWKKVWSDYKNNLKKKAARLHKSATGTGGGPAFYSKLSDLEQRVLKLIGLQTATGLPITEAGFSQDLVTVEIVETANQEPQSIESIQSSAVPGPYQIRVEPSPEPGPSTSAVPVYSPIIVNFQEESTQNIETPTFHELNAEASQVQPAQCGHTTPRHRASEIRPSPRRRVRPQKRNIDQAAEQFQRSDAEWRSFRIRQHDDLVRIRELELQMQREWHSVAVRTLELVDKVVDKFCKD